ncbi:hypothetical protein G6L12_31355 [Agrobacterium rhizogenes]|nr:hypothetical protein [Rhizobium rhizogenes]NTF78999.1 hypothetical protein [Rhizobium rhizogenes]
MTDTSVGNIDFNAFVVGSGLLQDKRLARVTVVITPGPNFDQTKLQTWPSHGHSLLNNGSIVAKQFDAEAVAEVGESSTLNQPDNNIFGGSGSLDTLWNQAVLNGDEAQTYTADIINFWNKDSDAAQSFRAKSASDDFVVLPSLDAGILLPLERARQLLHSIAPADAPIHTIAPLRPAGWIPPPIAQNRLDWSIKVPPEMPLRGLSSIDHGLLAEKIVSHDASSVFDLIQSMHLRHSVAMHPPGAAAVERRPSQEHTPLDFLRSRLSHVMGSPILMRLFGFARDFLVELPHGDGKYWCLRFSVGDGSALRAPGCVVKHGPGFSPASRADFKMNSAPFAPGSDGVLSLDPAHFALVTLDPATAVEGDANRHRNNAKFIVQGRPQPPHNPTTSGLSLAWTPLVHPLEMPKKTDHAFAEDLATFNRLDIGIVLSDTETIWRCPGHKLTTWSDPRKAFDINAALESLIGGGKGLRQFELEAAIFADQVMVEQTAGPHSQDSRLVTYNSEPLAIGLDQLYWEDRKKNPEWGRPRTELRRSAGHIPLDQSSRLPSSREEDEAALLPLLRFGLEYRVLVRRVYFGGACLSLQQAAEIYRSGETIHVSLPAPSEPGFRFLRHEAVAPPIVALGPKQPTSDEHENWLQTPLNVALVSWNDYRLDPNKPFTIPAGHAQVLHTERVIIPPTVALHFAMLHEVFDDLLHGQETIIRRTALPGPDSPFPPGNSASGDKNAESFEVVSFAPADGLQRLDLGKVLRPAQPPESKSGANGGDDIKKGHSRAKIPGMGLPRIQALKPGAENDRQVPYYPEPAAATMMFALRLPSAQNGDWLEPPQAVRVRSSWPDVLPVYLSVVSGKAGPGVSRIQVSGPVNLLALGGQRAAPVTITLPKAEIATLVVWLVPDVADLADWFDIVERIATILTANSPKQAGGSDPYIQAVENLLGPSVAQRFTFASDPADRRSAIAALLVEALEHQPISHISQPQEIALSHLVPVVLEPPRLDPSTPLALARRLSSDDRAIATFLGTAGPTADWPGAYDEDGALQPIIGGAIEFDPASTSGLVLWGRLVAPTGRIDSGPAPTSPNVMPLDPPTPRFTAGSDGSVDLTPLNGLAEFLRIDNIPYPSDGRHGLRRYDLRELQLQAFEAAQGGVQVKRGGALQDGGARHVELFVRLVPRHLPQLLRSGQSAANIAKPDRLERDPVDISQLTSCGRRILRSTIRPASPDVKEMVPGFRWQGSAQSSSGEISWRLERYTTFRLILRRPWFSSGEDEQLGIVFWPPQVLDGSPDRLDQATLDLFQEEDLGPVGRYVTAWGRDPIRPLDKSAAPGGFMLSPSVFPADPSTLGADGVVLPAWQPTVLVPIVDTDDDTKTETSAFCGLRTFPVSYDPDRGGHWFLDLEPDLPSVSDGFLRLGLVRWQPHARLDTTRDGGKISSIRCSPPSVAWAPVAPRRTLSVAAAAAPSSSKASPRTQITVQLRGPGAFPAPEPWPSILVRIRIIEVEGTEAFVARDENGLRLTAGTDAGTFSDGKLSPILQMTQGTDVEWIASFILPLSLHDLSSRHRVVVEEYEAMPDAEAGENEEHILSRGALRFFAVLPLQPGLAPNVR